MSHCHDLCQFTIFHLLGYISFHVFCSNWNIMTAANKIWTFRKGSAEMRKRGTTLPLHVCGQTLQKNITCYYELLSVKNDVWVRQWQVPEHWTQVITCHNFGVTSLVAFWWPRIINDKTLCVVRAFLLYLFIVTLLKS